MQKHLAAWIAAICLFAGLPLMAQEQALTGQGIPEQLEELDTVVIVGGYVTPKMWKVSKDEHVMWVLGDAMAPAGAKWNFDPVEARLAESQLLIYPGRVDADFGFFRAIGLIALVPSAFKAAKNPDNHTLKEVLSPELYARWSVIKAAYAPRDNDLERWRPSIALGMLEEKIGEKFGPAQARQAAQPRGPPLRPLVDRAAKKHKVKVHTMPEVELKVEVPNPRGMLKSVAGLNLMDEKCLSEKLEYLERKIEYLKQKASGTTQDKAPNPVSECGETELLINKLRSGEIPDTAGILKVSDTMELKEKLSRQRLEAQWIAHAQGVLAKNKSTFAVLPMYNLKSPTGYLAKLRELGYTVEEAL